VFGTTQQQPTLNKSRCFIITSKLLVANYDTLSAAVLLLV
jgi:hypothetical protein